MFGKKYYVIELTRNELVVGSVKKKKSDSTVVRVERYDWHKDNLSTLFSTVRKKYSSRVKLLLSSDLVYVFTISIPSDVVDPREHVRDVMIKLVPETVDENSWDFKVVERSNDSFLVQAFALKQEIYTQIRDAVIESELSIDLVVPTPFSLAQELAKSDASINLVLYGSGKETCAMIVGKGLVLASTNLYTTVDEKRISELIKYVEDKYSVKPSKIYLVGTFKKLDPESIDIEHYQTAISEISAMVGIVQEDKIRGKDEEVLNLDLLKFNQNRESDNSAKKSLIIFIICAGLIIGLGIIFSNGKFDFVDNAKSIIERF